MNTTSPEPVGLRERKKARLRQELINTAVRLFHERGFEGTTTEEIAAAVGVSQRTFFRYFASKEAVVLAAAEGVDQILFEALRARPADEPPFLALRNAMRDHWAHLEREGLHLIGATEDLSARSPEILDTNLRYCRQRQEQLAQVVGERAGVDPATDPRPSLVAAVFFAALNNGYQNWCSEGCQNTERLLRSFLDQLDLLPQAIGDDWGTPRARSA
ncbi:TetR/AcrR family transcriptional regulator [Nocardiopsis alba]|uniref:TetR/AcrR family transcriptional regulator n=1 Tax=Nocardiopsis alba TaxID=53437 RepID=UPI0033B00E87